MTEINAVITIACRDLTKFFRDKTRILGSLIFPVIFIGVLGSSWQSNVSENLDYNYLTFVFTGVLAQTLFQSTASGIISLIEDRQNDFAQEMFIAPISRYSILIGKIIGETCVSFLQLIGVILFAVLWGVPISIATLASMIPIFILVAIFGGAFGVIVMSNLSDQRAANQIFPFLIFPQIFLSGVFSPIQNLPPLLLILSRISPMTYAVDLVRSIYYYGTPEYPYVVLFNPAINFIIVTICTVVFVTVGTYFFIKNERNR
jgi:ABC-2 type transport system permease protein